MIILRVKRIVVGVLEENCYIVTKNGRTLIVDPGDEASKIILECKERDVKEILITHNHFDHVGALKEVEDYFSIKANVKSGYFDYEIINTPGHTSDSVSFYFPKDAVLFSGDFIFADSIGRTDLATGSNQEMKESLEKIEKYPDNITVYPGHGESTTLGKEKANFPFYYSI